MGGGVVQSTSSGGAKFGSQPHVPAFLGPQTARRYSPTPRDDETTVVKLLICADCCTEGLEVVAVVAALESKGHGFKRTSNRRRSQEHFSTMLSHEAPQCGAQSIAAQRAGPIIELLGIESTVDARIRDIASSKLQLQRWRDTK